MADALPPYPMEPLAELTRELKEILE